MKYKAEILITLKDGIKNIEAQTLDNALIHTNMAKNPNTLSIGKYYVIQIDADNMDDAEKNYNLIASEILANSITETFRILDIKEL